MSTDSKVTWYTCPKCDARWAGLHVCPGAQPTPTDRRQALWTLRRFTIAATQIEAAAHLLEEARDLLTPPEGDEQQAFYNEVSVLTDESVSLPLGAETPATLRGD